MWHRISDINVEFRTAICSVCGPTGIKSAGKFTNGGKRRYKCRKKSTENKKPYRKHKKDYCEFCGFIAVNSVQLDVDHINGDNKNSSLDNLQTLCANCHRLKTFLNNDYIKKEGHPF